MRLSARGRMDAGKSTRNPDAKAGYIELGEVHIHFASPKNSSNALPVHNRQA